MGIWTTSMAAEMTAARQSSGQGRRSLSNSNGSSTPNGTNSRTFPPKFLRAVNGVEYLRRSTLLLKGMRLSVPCQS